MALLDPTSINQLIQAFAAAVSNPVTLRTFLDSVQLGAYTRLVPPQVPSQFDAVALITRAADSEGWIEKLVGALVAKFPEVAVFSTAQAALVAARAAQTSSDPVEEVFLPSRRPFVNRKQLRGHARDLFSPGGERILVVRGKERCGKSWTEHLLRYIASAKGLDVHRVVVSEAPTLESLAADVLRALSIDAKLPPPGVESPDREAIVLATTIAAAVKSSPRDCVLILDQFPALPLPAGVEKLIAGLARITDDRKLHLVLIGYPVELPEDLSGVALVEDVAPFTTTDMVDMVTKVAAAKKWNVTDVAIRARIELQTANGASPTLQEHFRFLRDLLRQLESGAGT